MFVEENGSLSLRDRDGNFVEEKKTVGYYTYRTAVLTGVTTTALQLNATYSHGGDNHRVYKTTTGGEFCFVSDGTVRWGTGVIERRW